MWSGVWWFRGENLDFKKIQSVKIVADLKIKFPVSNNENCQKFISAQPTINTQDTFVATSPTK